MCIKQVENKMYNCEDSTKKVSKNPNIQMIAVKRIHKASKYITIYRGKNLSLKKSLKLLVAFFLEPENFNKENVIKGLLGTGLIEQFDYQASVSLGSFKYCNGFMIEKTW